MGSGSANYETVRRRKDRKRIQVSLAVSAIYDAYDQVIGASVIARDVTQRKRSESAVSRPGESAPDAIVIMNGEGKLRARPTPRQGRRAATIASTRTTPSAP